MSLCPAERGRESPENHPEQRKARGGRYNFFSEALTLPIAEPVKKLFEEPKQEEVLHQELVNKQLSKLPPDSGLAPEDFADEPVAQ